MSTHADLERQPADVVIRHAASEHLQAVEGLLAENHLPTDGVAEAFGDFLVAIAGGAVVGVVGIERRGDYGLLRSAATASEWRGRGIADRLVRRVTVAAEGLGLRALYLLTTTAESYFAARGFTTIARDDVPDAIRATGEFTHACPASATVMVRRLDHSPAA